MQRGSSNTSLLHLHRDQTLDQRFGAALCSFGSRDQALPALRDRWQSYRATENRGDPVLAEQQVGMEGTWRGAMAQAGGTRSPSRC